MFGLVSFTRVGVGAEIDKARERSGLFISHVSFRVILGSILEALWLGVGSTSEALGGQKVAEMLSKNVAEIGIGKSRFQGRPGTKELPELVPGRFPPILAG